MNDKKKLDLIDKMDAFSQAAISQYQTANKLYVDATANTAQALHSLQTDIKEAVVESAIHITNEMNKSVELIHDLRDQVLTTATEIKQKQTEMNTILFAIDADVHDIKTDTTQLKTDMTQLKTDMTQLKTDMKELRKIVRKK